MRSRRILAQATTPTPSAADSACGEKNALSRTPGLARNHGLDRRGATDGCTIGDASPAIDEQTRRMACARRSLRNNAWPAPARPVRGGSRARRADDGGSRRCVPGLFEPPSPGLFPYTIPLQIDD